MQGNTFCVANESLLDHLAREFITHLTFDCCSFKTQLFLSPNLMIILPNLAAQIIFYPMLSIIITDHSTLIQSTFQGKSLKLRKRKTWKWVFLVDRKDYGRKGAADNSVQKWSWRDKQGLNMKGLMLPCQIFFRCHGKTMKITRRCL